METINAVAALAAIAQESRLAVFRLLVQAGPAGMVTSRQEGRFVIYEANFSTATNLVAFLTENCCGGQVCNLSCTTEAGKVLA